MKHSSGGLLKNTDSFFSFASQKLSQNELGDVVLILRGLAFHEEYPIHFKASKTANASGV